MGKSDFGISGGSAWGAPAEARRGRPEGNFGILCGRDTGVLAEPARGTFFGHLASHAQGGTHLACLAGILVCVDLMLTTTIFGPMSTIFASLKGSEEQLSVTRRACPKLAVIYGACFWCEKRISEICFLYGERRGGGEDDVTGYLHIAVFLKSGRFARSY